MVKEASKAAIKKDGITPKRRPGKPPKPGEVRTEKLVMRVHPDLMATLTERARERGITRSAYVEQLLVGWCRLDPRNRRLDMIGKYVPGAPDPGDPKRMSSFSAVERWQRFSMVSRMLLGAPPPREWFDSGEYGGDPDFDPEVDPEVHHRPAEDDAPNPPFPRRPRR